MSRDSVQTQAVSKIREFILQKIYSFRKPMTNYQIPQNTLLKYRFFYQFLLANERTVAKEIRDEYVDTMSKIYYSYFKSYSSRLLKVQEKPPFVTKLTLPPTNEYGSIFVTGPVSPHGMSRLRPGTATLLSRELCRYNVTLAGLCEVRWQGNGETTAGDHCYIYSGPKKQTGLYGVTLAIPKTLRKSLISWRPLGDRLLSARFLHQHGKMTVIVAYAPTDVADEDVKDAFFDQLHQAVDQAPPHDITIILTDANATLSSSDRSTGSPVGTTFVDRTTNDNGNRLLLLCHHNNLCVADTWFPQKQIHHWTWYSPDGRTRKVLDHILISRRWKSLVTNCRAYRGAELDNTDHRLLVAQLKLKLRANQHTKTQPRLDSSLLSDPNIATNFSCSIRRTLDALATDKLTDWQTFKESVIQSAHNALGSSQSSPNKPWISATTLDIIERRREARPSRRPDGISATEPPVQCGHS
ncbi:hypothetical protein PDJAM_G00251530 [Pangasius djambal]|uniref:Uncharacterized protein n=1 Tax=Pangasius djambal TaxID=1691987 RepID=A0ACC5YK03_9TELE|nr:hypothetical protein [Pangasius djambal]